MTGIQVFEDSVRYVWQQRFKNNPIWFDCVDEDGGLLHFLGMEDAMRVPPSSISKNFDHRLVRRVSTETLITFIDRKEGA